LSQLEQQRREVYYSGRVQGVGFRFTVRAVAGRFAVSGFVRNLPDGQVHLVVEGSTGEIDLFLGAIQAEMRHYIAATQQTVSPATGRFNAFEIRH
jgi:acylphosphatase